MTTQRIALSFFVAMTAFISWTQPVHAQYSSTHFLPPLYQDQDANNADNPDAIVVHVSTMVEDAFEVTAVDGAGNAVPEYTLQIDRANPGTLRISCSNQAGRRTCPHLHEEASNGGISTRGLIFQSTNGEPFFVRMDLQAAAQAGSVSVKGEAGTGRQFTAHTSIKPKLTSPTEVLHLGLATEDNTTLSIANPDPNVVCWQL